MRYELTDHEWTAIKPMLPNKPRGVSRVNDRRDLNGIFWVLRSGAPWRDLPEDFGPYTTCHNRFVRWRRAALRSFNWASIRLWLRANESASELVHATGPTLRPSANSRHRRSEYPKPTGLASSRAFRAPAWNCR